MAALPVIEVVSNKTLMMGNAARLQLNVLTRWLSTDTIMTHEITMRCRYLGLFAESQASSLASREGQSSEVVEIAQALWPCRHSDLDMMTLQVRFHPGMGLAVGATDQGRHSRCRLVCVQHFLLLF